MDKIKSCLFLAVLLFTSCTENKEKTPAGDAPRIVNIINFIRQTEPLKQNINFFHPFLLCYNFSIKQ